MYQEHNPVVDNSELSLRTYIQGLESTIQTIEAEKDGFRKTISELRQNYALLTDSVKELITASYFEETEAKEILIELARLIDFTPTKEITFTGTVEFKGRIDVPMDEIDSFDLEQALEDIYVDIHSGDVVIDNYSLYDVQED